MPCTRSASPRRPIRYATEAAIGALGSDAVVFASALEEIQETLGEFQDAGYATALLASLALEDATDGVAGFIFGRLHAFEQAMAHGALDEFSDVWDRGRGRGSGRSAGTVSQPCRDTPHDCGRVRAWRR